MVLEIVALEEVERIALEAGVLVMEVYEREFTVQLKRDASPLTEADLLADAFICSSLKQRYPHIPTMSEEGEQASWEERQTWTCYWCIDPIDGTREFINKNGDFTINIALVCAGEPVLGVVYAPVLKELYGAKKGEGAFKKSFGVTCKAPTVERLPRVCNSFPEEQLRVVTSRSHPSPQTKAHIKALSHETKQVQVLSRGSSLKLCMVASGEADVYPRLGPTMEWDTAAGDAIVRESGKGVYQYGTTIPLVYNKQTLLNPWFEVR